MQNVKLIVGLGNPGPKYEWTRHNLGFILLTAMAKKQGLSFKKESRLMSLLAEKRAGEETLLLLLPMTYMNLSGGAVRRACEEYKIPFEEPSSLLVVVDDVYVKFGSLRLRQEGSSGGHNGLKNIEEHLQTQKYARLRVGIGPEEESARGPLEEYVLGTFDAAEREALPPFVERGLRVLDAWQTLGWEGALKAASQP